MNLKQVGTVLVEQNKEAAVISAKMRAGKMINERLVAIVEPRLPLVVKGYARTELGQAVIANIAAGAIIKYMPTNEKALLVADAMIIGSADSFIGSFDFEGMIEQLTAGIDLSIFKEGTTQAQTQTTEGGE